MAWSHLAFEWQTVTMATCRLKSLFPRLLKHFIIFCYYKYILNWFASTQHECGCNWLRWWFSSLSRYLTFLCYTRFKLILHVPPLGVNWLIPQCKYKNSSLLNIPERMHCVWGNRNWKLQYFFSFQPGDHRFVFWFLFVRFWQKDLSCFKILLPQVVSSFTVNFYIVQLTVFIVISTGLVGLCHHCSGPASRWPTPWASDQSQ